jgi:hypothetical protein
MIRIDLCLEYHHHELRADGRLTQRNVNRAVRDLLRRPVLLDAHGDVRFPGGRYIGYATEQHERR